MMNKFLISLLCASICLTSQAQSIKNAAPSANPLENKLEISQTVDEQQIAAPTIEALGVTPEFDSALFNVDPKTFLNDLEFEPAKEAERYYFHGSSGDYASAEQAQGGGYYRIILGKTTQGETVAQDFYQDIDAPQTAPFILAQGKEKDFSTSSNNGRTIWYTPEGQVESIAFFQDGKRIGWSIVLQDAKPIMRIHSTPDTKTGNEHLIYDKDGIPIMYSKDDKHTAFYPNGSAMFYLDESATSPPIAWDEQGKPIPVAQIMDKVYTIILRQDEVFQYILNIDE